MESLRNYYYIDEFSPSIENLTNPTITGYFRSVFYISIKKNWVEIITQELPNRSTFSKSVSAKLLKSYGTRAIILAPRYLRNRMARIPATKGACLTSRKKLEQKHLFVTFIIVRV